MDLIPYRLFSIALPLSVASKCALPGSFSDIAVFDSVIFLLRKSDIAL